MSTVLYPLRRGVLVTGDRLYVYDREFAMTGLADPGWCRGSGQEARRTALWVLAVETGLVIAALVVGTMVAGPSPAADAGEGAPRSTLRTTRAQSISGFSTSSHLSSAYVSSIASTTSRRVMVPSKSRKTTGVVA